MCTVCVCTLTFCVLILVVMMPGLKTLVWSITNETRVRKSLEPETFETGARDEVPFMRVEIPPDYTSEGSSLTVRSWHAMLTDAHTCLLKDDVSLG